MFLPHWHEKKKFPEISVRQKKLFKSESPHKVFFPTIALVLVHGIEG